MIDIGCVSKPNDTILSSSPNQLVGPPSLPLKTSLLSLRKFLLTSRVLQDL